MSYLILCTALAMPSAQGQNRTPIVLAQAPTDAVPDVVEPIPAGGEIDWVVATLKAAKSAMDEKLWGPFVSIVIMALLSLFSFLLVRWKEFRERLHPYMGEIALVLSVLGYVAIGVGDLPAGATFGDWWAVVGPGIKTGLAAIGGFEIIGKRILKIYLPKFWALLKKWFGKKPKE